MRPLSPDAVRLRGLKRPCRLTEWKLNDGGYGRRSGKLAHRAAFEEAYGPVPPGLLVLHHCDNRPCIEPEHLYAGTNADNSRDAVERGRASRKGQRKLTPEAVDELRRRYAAGGVTYGALAVEYDVSVSCVSMAIRGRNWRDGTPLGRQNKPYAETVPQIRAMLDKGESYREIRAVLSVSHRTISAVAKGEL